MLTFQKNDFVFTLISNKLYIKATSTEAVARLNDSMAAIIKVLTDEKPKVGRPKGQVSERVE
jgi:hypothetical protein